MYWLLGISVIAAGALLLRSILQRAATGKAQRGRLGALRGDLSAIYSPLAQEIETRTTNLGITLHEAFGEREADRVEMAWHAVRVAQWEWEHLTVLVASLLSLLDKFLLATSGIVIERRIAVDHLRSRAVMDYVRLYEFLDQILFRPEGRFALQLRFLSRASTLLTKAFMRSYSEGAVTLDSSNELWTRLDCYFHDFDLIVKETLLAFRILLACQSPERAQKLALDLQVLLDRARGVFVPDSHQ